MGKLGLLKMMTAYVFDASIVAYFLRKLRKEALELNDMYVDNC